MPHIAQPVILSDSEAPLGYDNSPYIIRKIQLAMHEQRCFAIAQHDNKLVNRVKAVRSVKHMRHACASIGMP